MIRGIYVFVLIFCLFTGCYKEKITTISDSVQINSSYSLPIGEIKFQVNEYFEGLDTAHYFTLDSVAYNDTIYPNIHQVINKTNIETFDIASLIGNTNNIRSLTFRLIIINGYPTKCKIQTYLTSFPDITDSLFENGAETVPPASVNQEGMVIEPSITVKDIPASPLMLENLPDYTSINVRGEVSTTRQDIRIVRFFPYYELRIHIAVRIEIEYNINEL